MRQDSDLKQGNSPEEPAVLEFTGQVSADVWVYCGVELQDRLCEHAQDIEPTGQHHIRFRYPRALMNMSFEGDVTAQCLDCIKKQGIRHVAELSLEEVAEMFTMLGLERTYVSDLGNRPAVEMFMPDGSYTPEGTTAWVVAVGTEAEVARRIIHGGPVPEFTCSDEQVNSGTQKGGK